MGFGAWRVEDVAICTGLYLFSHLSLADEVIMGNH